MRISQKPKAPIEPPESDQEADPEPFGSDSEEEADSLDLKAAEITNAGLRESHPHDITITKEAPNYGRW